MIKAILLAVTVSVLAFAVLPGTAAADPEFDPGFSVHGEETELTITEIDVACATVEGEGEFENAGTGSINLVFSGCEGFGGLINCTSPEQDAGTIVTTNLAFHLKTITGKKTPAILLTPNEPDPETDEGHFATFECSFLAEIVLTGTGVIGEITEKYNEELSTMDISFTSDEENQQTHTTVDGDETERDLHASLNEEEAETASLDMESTLSFTGMLT